MTAREQRANCPPGKNVTLQSDSCGSEPLLRPNYNSRWRGQRRNFIVGTAFYEWWGFFKGDSQIIVAFVFSQELSSTLFFFSKTAQSEKYSETHQGQKCVLLSIENILSVAYKEQASADRVHSDHSAEILFFKFENTNAAVLSLPLRYRELKFFPHLVAAYFPLLRQRVNGIHHPVFC